MDEYEPCDTCRARSYVWVELPNGQELSYCGYHYRTYQPRLDAIGASILDLRYLIDA